MCLLLSVYGCFIFGVRCLLVFYLVAGCISLFVRFAFDGLVGGGLVVCAHMF